MKIGVLLLSACSVIVLSGLSEGRTALDQTTHFEVIEDQALRTVIFAEGNEPDSITASDNCLPTRRQIASLNPAATIEYYVPVRTHVSVSIYNVMGDKVSSLVDSLQEPGNYTVRWDGTDSDGMRVSVGVYFYQFSAGEFREPKKMITLE